MNNLNYRVSFYSFWHAGSGITSGMDKDSLVIKSPDELPLIPGKTIKGLLKDSFLTLKELGMTFPGDFEKVIFGQGGRDESEQNKNLPEHESSCFFSNAELPENIQKSIPKSAKRFLYQQRSSTKIASNTGVAEDHSLRKIELTIPLTLVGTIEGIPDNYKEYFNSLMSFTKKMGVNRTRGLGRCEFQSF